MRNSVSYALLATYLVVQLFGQVIHTWSGCEHAHLPGHFHAHSHDAAQASSDHVADHKHSHCHHHCDAPSEQTGEGAVPVPGDGWNAGQGTHLAVDGCLICQHLALGQIAPTETDTRFERVPLDEIVPRSTRLATTQWLGPNSPRAPPVA
ncbi:MAG: hypothetical protein WD045_15810 [Pirellulaceae bacterium]